MLNTLNFMVSWRDGEVGRRRKSAIVVERGSFTCEDVRASKMSQLKLYTLYLILFREEVWVD